jgi:SAM-dependent methyltransferase
VAEVYLCHVLEHLTDARAFFREAYRCVQPNGSLLIRVPYGAHRAAWWDYTHVRPWYGENFAMLQPGYGAAVGNPQHDEYGWAFGIHIVQLRMSYRLVRWCRKWWVRAIMKRFPEFFDPYIEEIWAHLYALKTQDAIDAYRLTHNPVVVGMTYAAWHHHVTDTPPPTDGTMTLVDLLAGEAVNGYLARVRHWERA